MAFTRNLLINKEADSRSSGDLIPGRRGKDDIEPVLNHTTINAFGELEDLPTIACVPKQFEKLFGKRVKSWKELEEKDSSSDSDEFWILDKEVDKNWDVCGTDSDENETAESNQGNSTRVEGSKKKNVSRVSKAAQKKKNEKPPTEKERRKELDDLDALLKEFAVSETAGGKQVDADRVDGSKKKNADSKKSAKKKKKEKTSKR